MIADALESVVLPDGYTWGVWSGDHRKIERDGRVICGVGGVVALVCASDMQNETLRAIAKGERELARAKA